MPRTKWHYSLSIEKEKYVREGDFFVVLLGKMVL